MPGYMPGLVRTPERAPLKDADQRFAEHTQWAQRRWNSLIERGNEDLLRDPSRLVIENAEIRVSANGCELFDAVLRQCTFRMPFLRGAGLDGDFRASHFEAGYLDGACLSGGNFDFASFNGTSLRGADLVGDGGSESAILRNVKFLSVDLTGAKYFRKGDVTDIRGATFNLDTDLPCGISMGDFVEHFVPRYIEAAKDLMPLERLWESVAKHHDIIEAMYETRARAECPIEHHAPLMDFFWLVHNGMFADQIAKAGRTVPAPLQSDPEHEWLPPEQRGK